MKKESNDLSLEFNSFMEFEKQAIAEFIVNRQKINSFNKNLSCAQKIFLIKYLINN